MVNLYCNLEDLIYQRQDDDYPGKVFKRIREKDKRYLKSLISIVSDVDLQKLKTRFVIVIYTYNNSDTIKLQYDYLTKAFDRDFFDLIYIDDSTQETSQMAIKEFADQVNAFYWHVPRVKRYKSVYFHNFAINLSWYKIIQYLDIDYFLMLDHDIFPMKRCQETFKDRFDKKINWFGSCGQLDDGDELYKYPWPGYSCFRKDSLRNIRFDFSYAKVPNEVFWATLDTGGQMHNNYFKLVSDYMFVNYIWNTLEGLEFELIDENWLHLKGLSYSNKDEFLSMNNINNLYNKINGNL